MDPKVRKFMNMLDLADIRSFASIGTYLKVKGLQRRYAKTTLEDYLWRLVRELHNTKPTISPVMVAMYYELWVWSGGVKSPI
jgi:hypothetical protein